MNLSFFSYLTSTQVFSQSATDEEEVVDCHLPSKSTSSNAVALEVNF